LSAFFLCLLPFGYVQEKEQKAELPCKTESPLYIDENNNPILLDLEKMKDRATYCECPEWSALQKRARLSGTVVLTLLVDQAGNVSCIKVLSGHPLLNDAAVQAAKKWKFKPMKENEKAIAFYGTLVFRFTVSGSDQYPDPCPCARPN
jgi:TonB family protein